MDRDCNGRIVMTELDCKEFRSVLRMVLAPDSENPSGGGAFYSRFETNQQQILNYVLHKADINNDGWISFQEFEALFWVLRQEGQKGQEQDTSLLVFALFDLDTDGYIGMDEFREIYRFYLGHEPTWDQFSEAWGDLAAQGQSRISKKDYTKWLQKSAPPMFSTRADTPVKPEFLQKAESPGTMATSSSAPLMAQTDGFSRAARYRDGFKLDAQGWPLGPGHDPKDLHDRPKWNQKWNWKLNPNFDAPAGQRQYFTKTQSLPALKRFYNTHTGFGAQLKQLDRPKEPKEIRVVSTDTQPVFNKQRHKPGGAMKEHLNGAPRGELALWEDSWQTPLRYKARFRACDRPVPAYGFLGSFYEPMGPMAKMLNRRFP